MQRTRRPRPRGPREAGAETGEHTGRGKKAGGEELLAHLPRGHVLTPAGKAHQGPDTPTLSETLILQGPPSQLPFRGRGLAGGALRCSTHRPLRERDANSGGRGGSRCSDGMTSAASALATLPPRTWPRTQVWPRAACTNAGGKLSLIYTTGYMGSVCASRLLAVLENRHGQC